MTKINKSDEEWRAELTPEQYRITREKGTERAFTGEHHDSKTPGTYQCVCCEQELFRSDDKFDSGSGWPSFTKPAADECVAAEEDQSLGMARTEVLCSRCDAHLGHVFPDGPAPTGLRFCINSASLKLAAASDAGREGMSDSPHCSSRFGDDPSYGTRSSRIVLLFHELEVGCSRSFRRCYRTRLRPPSANAWIAPSCSNRSTSSIRLCQ